MADITTVLKINFEPFGGIDVGSSRLRVWMLANELEKMGHTVTVNGKLEVDIQIFQKVRNISHLRAAKEKGAFIVYDIDDNYLLADAGTKSDVLQFLNLVDLVTVGSEKLHQDVSQYHDHVWLFENPVDIPPNVQPKTSYNWKKHLGWFGNRCNLAPLEQLNLKDPVITVTRNGDIEWQPDTIDEELKNFDLVLIPFHANEWNLSKNANRMLKCVMLGVPFLASRTPEHCRMLELLDLPEWLLLDNGADWGQAISAVGDRYTELVELLPAARTKGMAEFGVSAVTQRWLNKITQNSSAWPAWQPATDSQKYFLNTDVVIFNINETDYLKKTLHSLRRKNINYHSVSIVSALKLPFWQHEELQDCIVLDEHDDFFAVYKSLAQAINQTDGKNILFLHAGAELTPGFFTESIKQTSQNAPCLFQLQRSFPKTNIDQLPPSKTDELLAQPYTPHILLMPRSIYQQTPGLQSQYLSLALWELLIAMLKFSNNNLQTVVEPVVLIHPTVLSRHIIQSYSRYLEHTSPELSKEMPGHDDENIRLSFVLQSWIIDTHNELFTRHQSVIIPRLQQMVSLLNRRLRRETGYNELVKSYNKRNRQLKSLEKEYHYVARRVRMYDRLFLVPIFKRLWRLLER